MELPDFTRGMVLMGRDADGILRVIGLDDEGRISAFVIDSRDAWGRMLSVGNAELAVRLGSAVAYDRRGEVVFIETFETGWGLWNLVPGGGIASAKLNPGMALSGGYALKLLTGGSGTKEAEVTLDRGIYPTGRVGLEFAFALDHDFAYVKGALHYSDTSGSYESKVRYVSASDDLEVYTGLDTWEWVADVSHVSNALKAYSVMKLVIDLATQKYERVLFGDSEHALTTHSYYKVSTTVGAVIQARVALCSVGAGYQSGYIDDVIVTVAEPAN